MVRSMRPLYLLVCFAACRFDLPELPPAVVDAPSGTDAVTRMDAAIDAAPSKWVVIDTLLVPGIGTVMTSNEVLESGVVYTLRASGTYQWDGPDSVGDAEYYDIFGTPHDGAHSVDVGNSIDIGLAIDEPQWVNKRAFRWGAYNPSHTYVKFWVGKGAPITAQVQNIAPSGDTGFLVLEILAFQ